MNTTLNNFPTSMMTPSPSPDELVIQQRGRRKIPVTFSPDIDTIKQVSLILVFPSFMKYSSNNI